MSSPKGPTLETDVSRILDSIPGKTPADTGNNATLILTIGLPGSGKSTFCRRLAPHIDAAILDSDALRRLLFGEPDFTPAESRRLFESLYVAAGRLLEGGRTVIIDATNVTESDRRPAYAVAASAGVELLQLRFFAPDGVIEQRLAKRSSSQEDSAGRSAADIRVYRRMATREETPRREYWNIDTSDAEGTEAALSRVVEVCRPQTAGGVPGGVR